MALSGKALPLPRSGVGGAAAERIDRRRERRDEGTRDSRRAADLRELARCRRRCGEHDQAGLASHRGWERPSRYMYHDIGPDDRVFWKTVTPDDPAVTPGFVNDARVITLIARGDCDLGV